MSDSKKPDFKIDQIELDEVSDNDLDGVSGGACDAGCEGRCGCCNAGEPMSQL